MRGRLALAAGEAVPYVAGGLTGVGVDRALGWRAAAVVAAVALAAVQVALRPVLRRGRDALARAHPVPRVLGLPLADAKAALAAAGFSVRCTDGDRRPGVPEGVVVSQQPRAGESLPGGAAVRLTTSRLPAGT